MDDECLYDKRDAWLSRRERFAKILREGKRSAKLEEDERTLVMSLCEKIERRTKELKREG